MTLEEFVWRKQVAASRKAALAAAHSVLRARIRKAIAQIAKG